MADIGDHINFKFMFHLLSLPPSLAFLQYITYALINILNYCFNLKFIVETKEKIVFNESLFLEQLFHCYSFILNALFGLEQLESEFETI